MKVKRNWKYMLIRSEDFLDGDFMPDIKICVSVFLQMQIPRHSKLFIQGDQSLLKHPFFPKANGDRQKV